MTDIERLVIAHKLRECEAWSETSIAHQGSDAIVDMLGTARGYPNTGPVMVFYPTPHVVQNPLAIVLDTKQEIAWTNLICKLQMSVNGRPPPTIYMQAAEVMTSLLAQLNFTETC